MQRMCAAMAHRGPDDSGLQSNGACTLGMRRLAIFDPAHGHQPWRSRDRRFTLVFNGAVYNFREVAAELQVFGYRFETACDTEVLLAAFQQWGESCLSKLRGMFAFAIWDGVEQRLFMARDPLGIKPLYVCVDASAGTLLFASELNALRAAGHGSFTVDPEAVGEYLAYLSIPAPRTLYREVTSLRPGELATWKDRQFQTRVYWKLPVSNVSPQAATDRNAFISELRSKMDETIRAHLVADVPVGSFLSGGLDSAIIAGLASKGGNTTLKTFSLGFDEPGYSEADAAATTARHLGTHHHASVITGAEVARDVDRLIGAMDQPTGDGINSYYVSAAARAGGVKVALSGLGADELFGGYSSFRQLPWLARSLQIRQALPSSLNRLFDGWLSRGGTRSQKLAALWDGASDLHSLAANSRRVMSPDSIQRLMSLSGSERGPQTHPALMQLRSEMPEKDHDAFSIISAWELRTYMADVLLRDSDVMSMRHSLELRVPFVDRRFVE